MALKLEIWRTGGGTWTDYSAWLFYDGVEAILKKSHAASVPQELTFSLTDGIAGFVAPDAGNRVRVTTDSYGVWFNGYLSRRPERNLQGKGSSGPGYEHRCQAISEEVSLEWKSSKTFPALPPFANMTQGAIVKALISALGGSLDVTNVDDGVTVPLFRVRPDESFMDAVRRLSDRTNMAFWTKNGSAYYESFGATAFGYSPDESDAQFDPNKLLIAPVQNEVYNDVIATGSIEPQIRVVEHIVGDGLTATWPLKFPLFGAVSTKLLEDPFTGAAINSSLWNVTDVNSLFSMTGGSLKMECVTSASASRLSSKRGVDMAGQVELRAGRISFLGPSNVIVGGIYDADTGVIGDCVAGFECTPSGAQTLIKPIASGAVLGSSYLTVAGKSYQFQLGVDVNQSIRVRRPYFSFYGSFGGETIAADAVVSYSVIELDDDDPDAAAVEVFTAQAAVSAIPAYLYYALLSGPQNGTDPVDLILNFCFLHKPIQAELWTKKLGASAYRRDRLGDAADPLARAAITVGSDNRHQLEFISLLQLDPQELGKIIYRSAGVARARVQDAASVAAEAAKSGDDGVRSGTLPEQSPAPRDAAELERACQAYIDDHTNPLYSGEWTFDRRAYPSGTTEPFPGRMMTVDAPTRYPSFSALVNSVESRLVKRLSDATEFFEHHIKFGPILRLDEESFQFQPADEALQGQLDTLVDQEVIDSADVGSAYASDVVSLELDSYDSNSFTLDAGAVPTDHYEVRKTDAAWGTASVVNKATPTDPTTQTFDVGRLGRDTLVLVKNNDGTGLVSRHAAAIRFVWPMPPLPPVLDTSDLTDAFRPVFDFIVDDNDDPQNVYVLEVRDSDNATVLLQRPVVAQSDLTFEYDNSVAKKASFSFYAYFYNLLGEYSSSLLVEGDAGAVRATAFGANLISNPGFESVTLTYDNQAALFDDRYLADAWVADAGSSAAFAASIETGAAARTGQKNGLVQLKESQSISNGATVRGLLSYPCASGDVAELGVPVRGGEIMAFGGWVRWDSDTGLPANVSGSVGFEVSFYESDGTPVSTAQSSTVDDDTAAWTYVSGLAAVPSGAAFARISAFGEIVNSSGGAFNTSTNSYMEARSDDAFLERANRSTHASYRPLSNPLTATDAGGDATVSVAAFTMRAGSTDVSVSSGSITALDFDTLYYVYYDDPGFDGGAVAFEYSEIKEDATSGENRYFVGSIRTPLDGGWDTVGNEDGGGGAKIGLIDELTMSAITTGIGGTGAIANADDSIDGKTTTYAQLSLTANGAANFSQIYLSTPPAITRRYASARMYVLYELPTNSIGSGTTNVGSVKIYYLDAAASIIANQNFTISTTRTKQTLEIDLLPGVNLSRYQAFITINSDSSNPSGSLVARIFKAWIRAHE